MSLHLGYGPVTAQRLPGENRNWHELYADNLAIAEVAETVGFDSVWVGEHHFTDDGYLPGPFPMLAAMAARTERILLGTRVIIAPLHHPLRIAEDAATVSILSGGRLILGLGIGYRQEEFGAFGVTMAQRASRLAETVNICRKAWTGQPFDYGGALLAVQPAPDGIPIWLGGRAAAALERAGRMGDGFVAPAGTAADLRQQVAQVDAAAGPYRRLMPVCISAYVALGEQPPSVVRGLDALMEGYGKLTSKENRSARVGQAVAKSGIVASGSPRQVAGHLTDLANAVGTGRDVHLTVRLEFPGMSLADVRAHVAMFAAEVMPRLFDVVPDAEAQA